MSDDGVLGIRRGVDVAAVQRWRGAGADLGFGPMIGGGGLCLVPWDKREAISIAGASCRAGVSVRTMRGWCEQRGIGRRVGGAWRVSQVALAMYLEGDEIGLASYLAGDRDSANVRVYFARFGLPLQRSVVIENNRQSRQSRQS